MKNRDDRKLKIQKARIKILDESLKRTFEVTINDNGTPIIPSYGLTVQDLRKE